MIVSNATLPGAAANKFSPRRALLVASPFMLMGAVAAALALYGAVTRQLDERAGKHLLTIMVVCAGLSLCIIGWFASKRPRSSVLLKASHPELPWMWREDWVAGRVDNSVRRSIFFLWVAAISFNLVCVLAVVVILHGLRYGNQGGWLALFFPVVGLAVVVFAARTTRDWGRFGRAAFVMQTCPAVPGSLLAGELRVPAWLAPKHAFYLRLSCVRRTTSQRGKTRVTTERVLWQDEKWFRPTLPQPEAGATRLPVFVSLPADLPESTTATSGDEIQWRLEVDANVSGPDFHGSFEVPVFKSATVPAVAALPVTTDSAHPYQLTLDEVRKEIRSRIEIVEQAGGREFIFPAGRNPGFASGAAALWLVWTGAIILMLARHAPPLFPLIFTALDALMGIFVSDLWLRRSRVLVTPVQIKMQTSWLLFKQETTIAAAEVANLRVDLGATAGHAAYYDLKIRARNGREYLAAKNLSHKPEADWLIRQMMVVLKSAKSPTNSEDK